MGEIYCMCLRCDNERKISHWQETKWENQIKAIYYYSTTFSTTKKNAIVYN